MVDYNLQVEIKFFFSQVDFFQCFGTAVEIKGEQSCEFWKQQPLRLQNGVGGHPIHCIFNVNILMVLEGPWISSWS